MVGLGVGLGVTEMVLVELREAAAVRDSDARWVLLPVIEAEGDEANSDKGFEEEGDGDSKKATTPGTRTWQKTDATITAAVQRRRAMPRRLRPRKRGDATQGLGNNATRQGDKETRG